LQVHIATVAAALTRGRARGCRGRKRPSGRQGPVPAALTGEKPHSFEGAPVTLPGPPHVVGDRCGFWDGCDCRESRILEAGR